MADESRTELRGPGWDLSLQRHRAISEPGLSSNLGAAPLVTLGRRGSTFHVAVRLADGERLWVSVTAASGTPVTARLPTGRTLVDEVVEDAGGGDSIHRLARIDGAASDGIGEDEAVVFRGGEPAAESLNVSIGPSRVSIALVRADAFDDLFGAPPQVQGHPSVYACWRLP